MSEARSLGQMYAEAHHAVVPELSGSLGEQYAGWLDLLSSQAVDDASRAPRAPGSRKPARSQRSVPTRPIPRAERDRGSDRDETRLDIDKVAHRSSTRPAPRPRPSASASEAPAPPAPIPVPVAADATQAQEEGGGVIRSSALMAAGTLLSKLLGFVRVVLLAGVVGTTTRATNVFDTANTLPNMIYILLAGGVINAVFVPQITRSLKHEDGGKAYTDRLLTLSLSALLIVTVVMTAAAPLLYKLFDPHATGARLHLGVVFSVICLPQLFFYGIYTLFGEVLNGRGRFGAFMWSPVLANVVMIAGLLVMMVKYPHDAQPADWTPGMIALLAGSATLGIVAQALVLIWPLKRAGYTFTPNFSFRGVGLRATSQIAGWAFAAVVIQQIGLLVNSQVLNSVPDNYGGKFAQSTAYMLFMLPHGIVTVSLVTALYTRLSKAAARGDNAAVRDDTTTGFRLSALASVGVTFGCLVLVMPLAGLFFHGPATHGQHDSRFAVGAATIAMMIGLVPFTFCVLIQRVFFAYEDARTPFYIQIIGTAVTIATALLALALPAQWIGPGVALGQSASFLAQTLVGYVWLRRHTGPIDMSDVWRTYARLAVAAIAATACAGVVLLLASLVTTGRMRDLLTLVFGGAVFAVAYVAIARRLHVREIDQLVGSITSRVPGFSRG